jgi:hypothetical protein
MNRVMSKPVHVTRTDDARGTKWSFGHIGVEKNSKEAGFRLTYWSSPNTAHSTPVLTSQECAIAADVLRAAVVNAGGSQCEGKSIYEQLWEELMAIMERLMTGQEAEDGRDPGRAEGVAHALAVFTNPYIPNIEAIREEAMDRWEAEGTGVPAPKKEQDVPEEQPRHVRGMRARRRARGVQ